MRLRGSFFWGIVLIVLAALLLMNQQGWLKGNIFGYFWPTIVILFGLWLLLGGFNRRRVTVDSYSLTIPLENARTARIKFDHGTGRLNVGPGASQGELLNGTFGAEVEQSTRVDGDRVTVKLRNLPHFWDWNPGETLDWDVHLNPEIPLDLKVDSGASSSKLDLTDLKVVDLDIDTGASSTEVKLPVNAGHTTVKVDCGAASLNLQVPAGVDARIRINSGIASIHVDSTRFPSLGEGLYQSDEYATATNRADIKVETGVGPVDIR